MVQKTEVIRHLNIILRNELTAINQYFLHSRTLRHMGYTKLADKEYEESIDEMKHADWIIQRILYLEGLPNLQDLGQLRIGENPVEMLRSDYELELRVFQDLMAAHAACEQADDRTSITLVEDIIKSEEEHIEWLRAQLGLVESLGVQNFLLTLV